VLVRTVVVEPAGTHDRVRQSAGNPQPWTFSLLKSAASTRSELREFRFERVLSDQALAPERRGFRDRLVVPLLEGARALGIAAGRIA
jgi:hypothetical protein